MFHGGPHHHHHHHRRRRMTPMGRFVRAKLRRRIFAWFLGGILTTTFVVFLIMSVIARIQEPEWARSWEGGREWVGKQFAREWADPAARERFARETAKDLNANVELYDAQGALLWATPELCRHATVEAPIRRDGATVGSVKLCLQRAHDAHWRTFVFLAVFLLAVWKVSGGVARRLAAPLDELTGVVRRIGDGDLKARAEFSCESPDEIGLVADAVNDMAARIEKQVEDQRELLATVSHELRTPLARLRIISELGRDTGASERTFDELDREVQEMDALVGEL
ncbi:MAG: HAMP domain-containing protein, partial [Myxococcota bacterium]